MKLLIDGTRIVTYAPHIEFGVYDESFEKWGLFDSEDINTRNVILYVIDHNYTLVENVELPEDYVDGKYYFENGQFILDENWQPPLPPDAERITQLESQVAIHEENDAELLYQICLLQLGITENELSGKGV